MHTLATEELSIEQTLQYFPQVKHRALAVLQRIRRIAALPEKARILDIGSAQGSFLVVCAGLGYEAIGIEPWAAARALSEQVARQTGVSMQIVAGTAEALPLPSDSYDVVHANSVMEHVDDIHAAFSEAFRVLKPGGVFWFSSASSVCPRQPEIRGFPAFGWYPDPLKQRIMRWAAASRPALVGYTAHPAIHWFTPWKARRLLSKAGFSKVYDRWDLRLPEEGGYFYRSALRIIKINAATKFLADLAVPDCSFAAIK